jgi:hypothetical protein
MTSPSDAIDRREAIRRTALLLGTALSGPTMAAMLAGCDAPQRPGGAARALAPDQEALVAMIADAIIPTTDTPGAREAGVPRFIDTMLAEYYPPEHRAHFLAGLADVDDRARRLHQARFVDCPPDTRQRILAALDAEAFPTMPPAAVVLGRSDERGQSENATADLRSPRGSRAGDASRPPFFRTMKELTLLGYYTSQAGATRELRYARIPGRFDGCVPFATIGRAWSV